MKRRDTMFAIVLLLAFAGGTASAQLLNENFAFSGALTANGWAAHSGTGTNALSTTGGLTFGGYLSSAIGNAAFVSNLGGEDANIGLSDSAYTNGDVVYTSFLVNVTDTNANRAGDYFFHLGNRSTPAAFTSFAARVFAKIETSKVYFGISNLSTAGAMKYSPVAYAKNTPYLVILKYTINTGGVDTLKMWVKAVGAPGTEAAAGAPDAVADSSIQLGQDIIDAVALRQGSATTSVGLVVDGIRVAKSWSTLLVPLVVTKTYSIGTGNVPGETAHYATLKDACDSLNAQIGSIAENRLYYITSDLNEAANVTVGGNNSAYTITFKPYTGMQPTITFSQVADNVGLSGGWVIGLKSLAVSSATNYGAVLTDSTQNIIIDGSNTPNGTTRDLSLVTTATTHANTNAIRIFGNTNYITIKNIKVVMNQSVSYGILTTVRNSAVAGSIGNYVPDYITVTNCEVTNTVGSAGQGIAISNSGTPTAYPTGVVFSNNKITARTRGIFLNYSGDIDVYGNEINVNQTGSGSLSEGIFAFVIGSPTNVVNIYNNRLQILSTANTATGSFGIEGIYINTQGIYNIYNNIITGFVFPNGLQGLSTGIGITTATTGGITANVYHNSVYMANGGNTAGATAPTQAAFYLNLTGASGTRAVTLKNNIFATLESDYATYAMYVPSTNLGTLVSNYNDIYSAGGASFTGKFGATDCATLADWKTASGQDSNSVSGNPAFISDADLHINKNAYPVPVVSNAGTPVGAVTKDIDGDTRSLTTPDIGADEYTATPVIPAAGFLLSTKIYGFGDVMKDSTKTDSVKVTNNGISGTLTIDSVKSTNALFAITPGTASLDTNKTKSFTVKFKPTAKGLQNGKIIFYHNASNKIDTLTVSGNGVTLEPLFSAAPTALVFKGARVGVAKSDTITVTNSGLDTLRISAATSSDASFVLGITSAKVAPTKSMKVPVTFTPASNGAKSAALVFTSNTAAGKDTVKAFGTVAAQVSIAEARKDTNNDLIPDHLGMKDTLVVTGVVTSPNLQTTGTSYYIQDNTAGINVFSFNAASVTFAIGDSVMVTGTLAQFRGLTELAPLTVDGASLSVLKKNAVLPKPRRLTAKEFATNAEAYEGQLIEVDSLVKVSGTWPAANTNSSVFLTNPGKADTVQLFADLDTDLDGAPEPAYPINVVGLLVQFSTATNVLNNGYEIVPRAMTDIVHITILGVDGTSGLPMEYALYNNYPNPFNPSTTITFALPAASTVTLRIYDAIGREVASPVNDVLAAGYHMYQWNAGAMASGVYYYRISAVSTNGERGSFTSVKKLMLIK